MGARLHWFQTALGLITIISRPLPGELCPRITQSPRFRAQEMSGQAAVAGFHSDPSSGAGVEMFDKTLILSLGNRVLCGL